jgi:hypothetical protein
VEDENRGFTITTRDLLPATPWSMKTVVASVNLFTVPLRGDSDSPDLLSAPIGLVRK